jgi:exocyst complex component 3
MLVIQFALDSSYERYPRDLSPFLDNLGWIYQDLNRIESDVAPCFPSSYDMHSFYVKKSHKYLNAILQRLVALEPEATIFMRGSTRTRKV